MGTKDLRLTASEVMALLAVDDRRIAYPRKVARLARMLGVGVGGRVQGATVLYEPFEVALLRLVARFRVQLEGRGIKTRRATFCAVYAVKYWREELQKAFRVPSTTAVLVSAADDAAYLVFGNPEPEPAGDVRIVLRDLFEDTRLSCARVAAARVRPLWVWGAQSSTSAAVARVELAQEFSVGK